MSATLVPRACGVGAGIAADFIFGEPPDPHPVASFGTLMNAIESALWAPSRPRGVLYTGTGAGVAYLAGTCLDAGLHALVPQRRRLAAWGATACATYVACAGRALGRAAREIDGALARGDLEGARASLPSLVGRDPAMLDEEGIAAAVVESIAENTVDAVVAPALWALAGGAPGALAYRAVNTLDSMVGYRSERHARFGWASARLDDAMGWVPARVTAALVVANAPGSARAVIRAVRHDATSHPSPNAGVAEAAFAGALGLRLGGVTVYRDHAESRPYLGSGRAARRDDIERAVDLARRVAWSAAGGIALAGCLPALVTRPSHRRARGKMS